MMRKILHIIPSLNKGGAERIALDMCVELQNQGHEVQIVTLYPSNSYAFLTEGLSYHTVKTRVKLSMLRKNQVDVRELQIVIDTFQPDVIHSHLFEAEINLAFCTISKNCKRILHFHDNMKQMRALSFKTFFNKDLLVNYYERNLVLKNLPLQTTAIGVSNDTHTYIRENLPQTVKPQLLHNAIDTKRFTTVEKKQESNTIVMVGSLVLKKGQSLAIETISELKKRNVSVKLHLIGDGNMKEGLAQLTKRLDIEEEVDFKGLVDYPEKYFQESALYLHTASYEPFGLVLIEAMACGLPVICTDAFGNRDLIQEGENGYLIRERNPKVLADKIQFLLENENERKRMGENARVFAQDFGMEKYVERLLAVYNDSNC